MTTITDARRAEAERRIAALGRHDLNGDLLAQALAEPAFPVSTSRPGMTLRDWFAGQALQGQLATGEAALLAVSYAYAIADAMLAERSKGQ